MEEKYKNEIKACQNCKQDFIIESEDFKFYEKIKVPAPTFCPECRMIRRKIWRNCRSLYRRNCSLCHKVIISMYNEEKTKLVYCLDCWNGDKRDPFLQARDYDFSKPFFEQFKQLREASPILYVHHTGSLIRSEFTNYSADNKDCYLSYSVIGSENILYSEIIDNSKNSLDNYSVQKIENCSENVDSQNNYNCHYAIVSSKCIDSFFIYDCINCQNCCLSSNLRNQQYVFKNKKLNKEDYEKVVQDLFLHTYAGLCAARDYFDNLIQYKAIHRFAQIFNSFNVKGDYIINSKNINYSYNIKDSENIFYSSRCLNNAKDSYDNQGLALGELIYESVATSFGTYRNSFTYICIGSKDCQYSLMCRNCSNCFASIGLVNAQYCIFNKQYSKEDYFVLIEKIKKHMDEMPYIDKKGRVFKYGEFFPYDLCPFGINKTDAFDFFKFTKEESLEMGYPWEEKEKINYLISKKIEDIPDDIFDVSDDILNETISCPNNGSSDFQCTGAYKIVLDELNFYRHKKLPLPRYCPNCRHYQRVRKYRNNFKLYHRQCMKENCLNEFETSYAPERPEIVYCEECYKKEVY